MKVINYLVGYKGLNIVQDTECFNFSLDSILLANFVTLRTRTKKIIDLGTGNAPIPLILSTMTNAEIIGVEMQSEIYNLALESIKINNLDKRIEIINADARDIDKYFETDTFDVITCNPPYFKINDESLMNISKHKSIARHELFLNIDDILKISKKLLKNNGIIAMVHRPERMIEIFEKMRQYNIEPKKIRFVYPKENCDCNTILIEGSKNGKPGIKILSPLYVHNDDGNYTDEVLKMFGE
jgi:tRNA1(Val) A37 N6-methylase TrmN6